jgi:hypothetical protein
MTEQGVTPRYPLRNEARRRAWDKGISAWTDEQVVAGLARDAKLPTVAKLDVSVLDAGGVKLDGPDSRGHVDMYGDKRTMLAAVIDKKAVQEVLT